MSHHSSRRGRAIAAMALGLISLLSVSVPWTLAAVSGDLGTTTTKQTGRPTFAATSRCAYASPSTGLSGGGNKRRYLEYLYVNNAGADACVTVGWASSKNVTVALYLGSFDPNNVSQNLFAGYKTSTSCSGTSGSFSAIVPNGATYVVVVSECAPGGGGTFQFQVNAEAVVASIGMDIRKGSGPWVYVGSLSAQVAPGNTVKFGIRVRTGDLPERFQLWAEGADTYGYRIRYFHGTHEITNAINAHTYTTPLVGANSSFVIVAKVRVLSGAGIGSTVHKTINGITFTYGQADESVDFTVGRK